MARLINANFQDDQQQILQIRTKVFINEQQVPAELEVDAFDPLSQHVLLFENGTPVATGRLTPDGHIGRVAVLMAFRGRGFGRQVMLGLESIAQRQGITRVVLGAQCQAIPFYQKLNYHPFGECFMDAGIKHRMMEKQLALSRQKNTGA